ncbi:MAG: hypothetical protein KDD35_00965 [Bdellovibrionales bacterium]|nr:hypothetical protein [Bdellovibrionales bacterium]
MDLSVKSLFGVGLFMALSACGSKSNSKKEDKDADRAVKQAQEELDRLNEVILELSNKEARIAALKDEAIKNTLTFISPGGQPGQVILSGALVRSENDLDPRIEAEVMGGKSWEGFRSQVDHQVMQFKSSISNSEKEDLKNLKGEGTFVNLGCISSDYEETRGLHTKEVSEEALPVLRVLKAQVVLICDLDFKVGWTWISGDRVILDGVRFERIGEPKDSVTVLANKLILRGDSFILAKAVDGPSTLISGPSIAISADQLSGEGKLFIKSEGSSYLEATAGSGK